MGFFADPWLREARDSIKTFPGQPSTVNVGDCAAFDKLAAAVEKAIKAALAENHGSIPAKHNHNKLVTLCQSTGVWEVLPPALRHLVQEVESYQMTHGSLASSASPEQMQRYLSIARRLIDYMEYHVIGNDSVLRRLNVA
jgi:HEPN domain-containing protein